MDKKYELLENDTITVLGRTLHRIRAKRDINNPYGNIRAGDIGGYVEGRKNLSQDDNSWIGGNAQVFGSAWVCGDALVHDNARVHDNALVYGNARVHDNARVYGNTRIYGNAMVFGDARVRGNARVYGNAMIRSAKDIFWLDPIGSRDDCTTFFKTRNGGIRVTCGCFEGSIDDFLDAVTKTHGDNDHAQAYRLAVELAKLRLG